MADDSFVADESFVPDESLVADQSFAADDVVPIASVFVVDPAGRLLMQLRDGNTTADPYRWCLPGGHIEPGEAPLAAAHRELLEETGLRVERLSLFWHGLAPSARYPGAVNDYSVFYAPTYARDEDIVCGEGAGMWFVPAEEVATLNFGRAYSMIVPRFLASSQYRELVGDR